ncbi:Acg family FMN-binding oxidoreductase [Arhodomonas sp. SL1]|uniref:Acg family FMN-binding oxidoreductase n=1 Tax=Arhodomonas sp. SL1 TaxID=3425691 RepID=UPI003F883982
MSDAPDDEKTSTARLQTLLEPVTRAPSSHNTQPWRFRIRDGVIELYADRTRALPVNDPEDRELTISCGCALMNLRVAAAQAGLRVDCTLLPEAEDEDLFARVSLQPGEAEASAADAGLFPAIDIRRTFRKRFSDGDVPADVLEPLSRASEAEGAWLHVVEPDDQRHGLAALVAEGDGIQWSDRHWRRELAAWMHPRRRGDGLTVPGLVAPFAQAVVRTFDMGNGVGAKDRELADASPVLAVLGTGGDGVADWLHAGQALERLLLTAAGAGLQASYLNQPVQVASLRPKLQHLLGRDGFPQAVLRLGYPMEELPAAPRRPLEAVIDPS